MEQSAPRSRRRRERVVVSIGFSALAAAVLIAYANPATGYELSIYGGTPLGFWVGLGVALVASVFAALLTRDGTLRLLALTLGGCSITAFAGLPILRGYLFFASGDSLTHLGWIRAIAAEAMDPTVLIYPGMHTGTILIARLSGFRFSRSAMLMVLVFVVVYLLFITLSMRALTASGLGRAIGAASAFLLLPINVIVTKLAFHPISQSTLYFALVFFLFVKYVTRSEQDRRVTSVGALLAMSTAAIVLYHPQQAAVVLVFFGTISGIQLLDRWRTSGRWIGSRSAESWIGTYSTIYAQTLFLAVVFVFWAVLHDGLTGQVSVILSAINEFIQGSGGQAAQVVSQRQSGLSALGSGLREVFLKLFLVGAIYSVLAGVVILASMFSRFEREDSNSTAVLRYVSFGFMVLAPFAFFHFVGRLSKLYFRYHASLMLIVTVLGAFGLYYFGYRVPNSRRFRESAASSLNPFTGRRQLDRPNATDGLRSVVGVALVAMLALSLATAFPSLFIYQPSVHVTEAQLDGYGTAFDHRDDGIEMSGVMMPVYRYHHAVLGLTVHTYGNAKAVTPEFDHDIDGFLVNRSRTDGARYLVVTTYDREVAVRVWEGIRFTRSDFRALETDPRINRVQSNGAVRLYLATSDD